jgi:hypothetical protein
VSELSQRLRSEGAHDAAYAVEVLEEACALYVEELEVVKEHLLTIRDWLGENKLNAIDNIAGEAAAMIGRRLTAIRAYRDERCAAPPRFIRPGVTFNAAHAAEEAGELVAALGKLLRWGPDSYNPDLPPEQRETNIEWVRREYADLREAMSRLELAMVEERSRNDRTE